MRSSLLVRSILPAILAFAAQPALAEGGVPPAPDVAAVAALGPVPKGRLSDAAVPLAYRLDLSIDPEAESYAGRAQIDVTLGAPARYIDMHGLDLAVSAASATIGGKTYRGHWTQLDETGVARLVFDDVLPAGPATLDFAYTHAFNDGPAGLFRVKVGDRWFAWSQFESIDARQAFPSFDQPGFKVPFTVTLRTRPGQAAISNTPEISTTLEDGWQVHRFAPTKPLPTYLVAFMVGPFAMAEGAIPPSEVRKSPIPLRVVTTPPNAADTGFALTATQQIVPLLEEYFASPYPFAKLDQVTSPILPGAMENAGAILYEDRIAILGENATTARKRRAGMVMAHELGHQWFGDLVTPEWWDDIWLNESFANWVGYYIADKWRPDLHVGAGALGEGFEAMDTDALLAGRPIRQRIDANGQIDAAFDSITYGKGGQVIMMIAAYMGEAKFRDGVRRHLSAHAYGNARGEDFFNALAQAAGDPRIVDAMKSFVEQQGVPLITLAGGNGHYTVSQSRYVRLGSQAPDVRWTVPLCMRRDGARECTLLDAKEASIAIDGSGPVLPNAGGTGYYRFELPAPQWDALIATADRLPSGEAQAVADSLRASFKAGRATPGQLIDLARKLADNPDSYALAESGETLSLLSEGAVLDKRAAAALRQLAAGIYGPKLAALGFDPARGVYDGADPQISARRETLVSYLAFMAEDGALRKTLAQAARAYLKGDADALDPAFMSMALNIYIAQGGRAEAEDLAGRALSSQDPVFRPVALAALNKKGDPDIARWLLDGLRDDRLRATERLRVLSDVFDEDATRDFAESWLGRNYDALVKEYGGNFVLGTLPGMFSDFCSRDGADRLQRQYAARFAGTPGELSFARTMEAARDCAVLTRARGKEMRAAVLATARSQP